MAILVISRRVFQMKHHEKLIPLLEALRQDAAKQEGFESRKTYSSVNSPGEYMVISEWQSVDHWNVWMKKSKTRELQGQVDSLIGERTVFDIYQPEEF